MEILKVNGLEYSRKSFEDYKFRAKVEIRTVGDVHVLDIYTTDADKKRVENVLLDRKTDAVTSLDIFHWTTREQDDASAKFIEEFLN